MCVCVFRPLLGGCMQIQDLLKHVRAMAAQLWELAFDVFPLISNQNGRIHKVNGPGHPDSEIIAIPIGIFMFLRCNFAPESRNSVKFRISY